MEESMQQECYSSLSVGSDFPNHQRHLVQMKCRFQRIDSTVKIIIRCLQVHSADV